MQSPKLEWLTLSKNNENAGELLACFELYPLDNENVYIPPLPPKCGSIYRVPNGIRPEMQRTVVEVSKTFAKNLREVTFLINILNLKGSFVGC